MTRQKVSKKKVSDNKESIESNFYFYRLTPLLIIFIFLALPISMQSLDLFNSENTAKLVYPLMLPFRIENITHQNILQIIFFIIYFIPLSGLVILTSFFLKKIKNSHIYILSLISSIVHLVCCFSCILMYANTYRWFMNLDTIIYINIALSFCFNVFIVFFGIYKKRYSNPQYQQYKILKKEAKLKAKENIKIAEQKRKENLRQIKSAKNEALKTTDLHIPIKKESHDSVKTKLTIAILSAITVIILSFSILVIISYKEMITATVSEMGRSQAEQAAAVYDSADGKYGKIQNFFETQKIQNSYADTPYERIDIIITGENQQIFLEEVNNSTKLPPFDIFAYTTEKHPSKLPPEEKKISNEQAHEYIRRFQNGTYRKAPVYNKQNGTCCYVHPVSFTRTRGSKLVGFAIVTYRQEVLLKSFFQTKVFVLVIAFVLLYISIILSVLLGDYIANPLLYLRMNVHKSSDILSNMLSGTTKLIPDNFIFEDEIKTKDEVKELSEEIGNMVSIIRGVMPYISFTTLKHAEKDAKRISTSRDLCFLFTDIRGFTSLCEGLPPKEVVSILNKYLDIETEIIHKNGGDIDKFVGDEMMAFFAGPKKEINACKAAMEIRTALKEEQQLSIKEGSAFISLGIGINTGKVVFGPVGSSSRMDFTSIGDTVNLAARLEGANKAYGSKAIITHSVYEKLKDNFICRELDYITVKGKTEPVKIYEILQSKQLASDKIYQIKEMFEAGLDLYRKQKWEKAKEAFSKCNKEFNDLPSKAFLDRIRLFELNPPSKDWDGVFRFDTKF